MGRGPSASPSCYHCDRCYLHPVSALGPDLQNENIFLSLASSSENNSCCSHLPLAVGGLARRLTCVILGVCPSHPEMLIYCCIWTGEKREILGLWRFTSVSWPGSAREKRFQANLTERARGGFPGRGNRREDSGRTEARSQEPTFFLILFFSCQVMFYYLSHPCYLNIHTHTHTQKKPLMLK